MRSIRPNFSRMENVMVRSTNLATMCCIAFGIFLMSGCDGLERKTLFALTGETGPSDLTKPTMDSRVSSPGAGSTASMSEAHASKRAIQIQRYCVATESYNPLPIATIRFNGREGNFLTPLKAALDRITALKEDVGFELRMVIPSSLLADRQNVDVATPLRQIEQIKNAMISLGVAEPDMIYTARESSDNLTYEVDIFVLQICPYVIQGSEHALVMNGLAA